MYPKHCKLINRLLFLLFVVFFSTSLCGAELKGMKRKGFVSKPMIVNTISDVDNKDIAIISVFMEPGASSPVHTHPGDCYGSIVKGSVELVVEGAEPVHLNTGEAWHNSKARLPHYFKNVGDTQAQLVNTIIYDKGKKRTQQVAKK